MWDEENIISLLRRFAVSRRTERDAFLRMQWELRGKIQNLGLTRMRRASLSVTML